VRAFSIKFITIVVMGIILGSINTVYAHQNNLKYEYALTIDQQTVLPGTLVTAIASTTDKDIKFVIFLWKNPDGEVVFTEIEGVSDGTAKSSYRPDTLGEWHVIAIFVGIRVARQCKVRIIVRIRTASFNVVPEAPVVGVAGTLAAMLMGLHLYMKKMIKLR